MQLVSRKISLGIKWFTYLFISPRWKGKLKIYWERVRPISRVIQNVSIVFNRIQLLSLREDFFFKRLYSNWKKKIFLKKKKRENWVGIERSGNGNEAPVSVYFFYMRFTFSGIVYRSRPPNIYVFSRSVLLT